jgi:hypothetical protein
MGNVRNWGPAVLAAAVILLGPAIAFVMVVAVEILTDLVATAVSSIADLMPSRGGAS